MLSIWRRAAQFDRTRAALSTWVYTIARNSGSTPCGANAGPDFDPEDPALVGDNELAPRGDRFAEAEQARREVMRAVEQLPAEQAQLLRIFYFEEKPHSVIADELGLPLGTVKSRLRLALGKLRVLLNGLDSMTEHTSRGRAPDRACGGQAAGAGRVGGRDASGHVPGGAGAIAPLRGRGRRAARRAGAGRDAPGRLGSGW